MKIRKQTQLKAAIFEMGTTAREVSKATGIPESYISLAIHGRYVMDDAQKTKIAIVLKRKPEEIFA